MRRSRRAFAAFTVSWMSERAGCRRNARKAALENNLLARFFHFDGRGGSTNLCVGGPRVLAQRRFPGKAPHLPEK